VYLQNISASSFRPFESVSFRLCPDLNVFFGKNGNGKTSILEAVTLLSQGKSFRTADNSKLVKFGSEMLAVAATVATHPENERQDSVTTHIGVDLSVSGRPRVHVNSRPTSRGSVAKIAPTQVMDIESMGIITGGPEARRKFLDWLVFHVEPEYLTLWRRYSNALKQRNAMLKSGLSLSNDPWVRTLTASGEEVSEYRAQVLSQMLAVLETDSSCLDLLGFTNDKIHLELCSGWDGGLSLEDALHQRERVDAMRGITTVGPHRADVKIFIGGRLAGDVCSRGQLKRLMCALFISRFHVYFRASETRSIFLIDDVLAELDRESFHTLLQGVLEYGGQVLVTCLSVADFIPAWKSFCAGRSEYKRQVSWFHVEPGGVVEQSQETILFHMEQHGFE